MDYKSIVSDIKEILHFKLYCMYIINAVSLIQTFHLSEQNFEPMNQRGSDKRGCTVYRKIVHIVQLGRLALLASELCCFHSSIYGHAI